MTSVTIQPSTNNRKKLMAVFTLPDGGRKTVHFGSKHSDDYTTTGDKRQRTRYLARHRANENWDDPLTAGALSRHILWGKSTSRERNIRAYKRRFNLR